MRTIRITAKRQATLPTALCEDLGVGPGGALGLERRIVDGDPVWVLHGRMPDWSWVGAASRYARGKSNHWEEIERSIAQEWAGGDDWNRRSRKRSRCMSAAL